MIKMSLSELANVLHTDKLQKDLVFQGVSTDTRTLIPGNMFIALKGEHYDGHQFLETAVNNGAVAAVVNTSSSITIPQILVNDTLAALGKLSTYWRNQFKIPFISITGSNGKTTLKNMLASILRVACHSEDSVLATLGNLNNAIGVPLTLYRLNSEHRYGVIEMGMNHFGEIAYLTNLVKPTVAIITNAAESHLEGVGSLEGVAKAKGEIFEGLNTDGVAILNSDDPYFNYWKNLIKNHTCLTFGLKSNADISAVLSDHCFTLNTPIGNSDITLSLLGTHNIMNALAAAAAAIALGIDLAHIKKGLEQITPTPGRMRPYFHSSGACIIDDCYNANPLSLEAAVNTLASFKGTKIIVLGDMKELGPDEKSLHESAGKKMRAAPIDYLFTLGELSVATSEAFGKNARHFADRQALIEALSPYLQQNTHILVKGSRSMHMETIISKLIPEDQIEHSH
jgi:UDP-N-acetylmuramoyl-tripeptide--D-alanyl-D-alanine ligase